MKFLSNLAAGLWYYIQWSCLGFDKRTRQDMHHQRVVRSQRINIGEVSNTVEI
jgi:hypothetical protein